MTAMDILFPDRTMAEGEGLQDLFGQFAVVDATEKELTYSIPSSLAGMSPGSLCIVPLQRRLCVGVFLGLCARPAFKCRRISGILPFTRPVTDVLLQLAHWISSYYLAPLTRCVRLLGPGFLWDASAVKRRQKRFARYLQASENPFEGRHTLLEPFPVRIRGELGGEKKRHVELSGAQREVCQRVFDSPQMVSLLFGITGSGKTEVYIEAVGRVLAEGKNALILVPEIALTPQMSARFRAAFGHELAILHSGLTSVEYEREWFRAHLSQCRVLLGVRSAVFAPLTDIGLIIVDEEHDSSYKSDEFPCYQARDVAVLRARMEGARCLLGSATPSLESYYNTVVQRYQLLRLSSRVTGIVPQIEIIDARVYLSDASGRASRLKKQGAPLKSSLVSFTGNLIAPPVIEAMQRTKERGEQSMLILNRRGYASYGLCTACGTPLTCPACAVTTTLHHHGTRELCHYCGFQRKTPPACPHCQQPSLVTMGAGTQFVEEELARSLPELRVGRLDRDVLTSNTRLTEIIQSFRNGELDCLIGTQILTKGHDFPRVTTVAVLHVEDSLFLPDFRASERTFQLITQSAGRAGRAGSRGEVILQSLVPSHPVVDLALQNNVQAFLEREIEMRQLGWLPPVVRQILLEFVSKFEDSARKRGQKIREALVAHWKNMGFAAEDVRIVGPYPATLEKLREEYRFHICIASVKSLLPNRIVPLNLLGPAVEAEVRLRIDVDPFSFL